MLDNFLARVQARDVMRHDVLAEVETVLIENLFLFSH